MRKIIHIDMDAFFASVEQRDQPQWRGKPVIVGGRPESRGVVAAASYEARVFGVRSAMPSAHAVRLCPDGIFAKPRFDRYKEVSAQVQGIFTEYTELIEPLSLDEAYLDVSGSELFEGSATRIAQAIREQILEQTGLTASAGVSYNKFLAKVASDINKPNGMCVITPAQGEAFVAKLPVGQFYGVGKATEKKMQSLGFYTGDDLKQCTLQELQQYFGKMAEYYYNIVRGIDHRPVRTHRVRKSIGSETTFARDKQNTEDMLKVLNERLDKVWQATVQRQWLARTLTIKVKYADFVQVTRSHSFDMAVEDISTFRQWLPTLLARTEAEHRPVRLLGVTLSGFEVNGEQLAIPVQLDMF